MLQRIKQAVRRDHKSLWLAALFSGAFFAGNYHGMLAAPGLVARQAMLTVMLFACLYATFRLFGQAVRSRVVAEMSGGEGSDPRVVRMFVIYKEVVKTVVGVSMTLGWLAGLLFIAEHFGQMFVGVPVLMGLALSGMLFGMAHVFASFVDHIHYPH